MTKPSLLFLHRSVGENLINDSNLYQIVDQAGQPFFLSDFNQNTDSLRHYGGRPQPNNWRFPGGDTTPGDYAQLFSAERLASGDPMLQEILSYDIIAIKSCYPNTRITSDKMLAEHQRAYEQIVRFFQMHPTKKLAILTSPPLVPLLTLPPFAQRARTIASWLSSTDFGSNIFVYNFFDELAIPEGQRQANTLRKAYRRRFPLDAHPNAEAAKVIAPKIVAFLAHVVLA